MHCCLDTVTCGLKFHITCFSRTLYQCLLEKSPPEPMLHRKINLANRTYKPKCCSPSTCTKSTPVKKHTKVKRLNRMFLIFNQTKQDRMQFFKGILFFQAMNNTKTNKELSCCQLGSFRSMCASRGM